MIFADEAFSIFRKWKSESSPVKYLGGSLDGLPANPPRGYSCVVDVEPPRIWLSLAGSPGPPYSINLEGATFEYSDTRETSCPAFAAESWVCFVKAILPGGRKLLFAELATPPFTS
jgi:hypothetical protein